MSARASGPTSSSTARSSSDAVMMMPLPPPVFAEGVSPPSNFLNDALRAQQEEEAKRSAELVLQHVEDTHTITRLNETIQSLRRRVAALETITEHNPKAARFIMASASSGAPSPPPRTARPSADGEGGEQLTNSQKARQDFNNNSEEQGVHAVVKEQASEKQMTLPSLSGPSSRQQLQSRQQKPLAPHRPSVAGDPEVFNEAQKRAHRLRPRSLSTEMTAEEMEQAVPRLIHSANEDLHRMIHDMKEASNVREQLRAGEINQLRNEIARLRSEASALRGENEHLKKRIADDVMSTRHAINLKNIVDKLGSQRKTRISGMARLEAIERCAMEGHDDLVHLARHDARIAPVHNCSLVFTDCPMFQILHSELPSIGAATAAQYLSLVRTFGTQFRGYEAFARGEIILHAFASPVDAICFASAVQQALLDAPWPDSLLHDRRFQPEYITPQQEGTQRRGSGVHNPAASMTGLNPGASMSVNPTQPTQQRRLVFRGLRARSGILFSSTSAEFDVRTGRMAYYGREVIQAARICAIARPGEIVVSAAFRDVVQTATAQGGDMEAALKGLLANFPTCLGNAIAPQTEAVNRAVPAVDVSSFLPGDLKARRLYWKRAGLTTVQGMREFSEWRKKFDAPELWTPDPNNNKRSKNWAQHGSARGMPNIAMLNLSNPPQIIRQTLAPRSVTSEMLSHLTSPAHGPDVANHQLERDGGPLTLGSAAVTAIGPTLVHAHTAVVAPQTPPPASSGLISLMTSGQSPKSPSHPQNSNFPTAAPVRKSMSHSSSVPLSLQHTEEGITDRGTQSVGSLGQSPADEPLSSASNPSLRPPHSNSNGVTPHFGTLMSGATQHHSSTTAQSSVVQHLLRRDSAIADRQHNSLVVTAARLREKCAHHHLASRFAQRALENYERQRLASVDGTLVASERPPVGEVALCFMRVHGVDTITKTIKAEDLKSCMDLYSYETKQLAARYDGYIVRNEGDLTMLAFRDLKPALDFSCGIHQYLMEQKWPDALGAVKEASTVHVDNDVNKRKLFCGLRVCIAISYVKPQCERDSVTGKIEYHGADVQVAAQLLPYCRGGETLVGEGTVKEMKRRQYLSEYAVAARGSRAIPNIRKPEETFMVLPPLLAARVKVWVRENELVLGDAVVPGASTAGKKTDPSATSQAADSKLKQDASQLGGGGKKSKRERELQLAQQEAQQAQQRQEAQEKAAAEKQNEKAQREALLQTMQRNYDAQSLKMRKLLLLNRDESNPNLTATQARSLRMVHKLTKDRKRLLTFLRKHEQSIMFQHDNAGLIGEVPPTAANITLCFVDIFDSEKLLKIGDPFFRVQSQFNLIVCDRAKAFEGYRVKHNGEDAFLFAFGHIEAAVRFAAAVNQALMGRDWPTDFNRNDSTLKVKDQKLGTTIYNGPRPRIGIASGPSSPQFDVHTRRTDYVGPVVVAAYKAMALCPGGDVRLTPDTMSQLYALDEINNDLLRGLCVMPRRDPANPRVVSYYSVLPVGLTPRWQKTSEVVLKRTDDLLGAKANQTPWWRTSLSCTTPVKEVKAVERKRKADKQQAAASARQMVSSSTVLSSAISSDPSILLQQATAASGSAEGEAGPGKVLDDMCLVVEQRLNSIEEQLFGVLSGDTAPTLVARELTDVLHFVRSLLSPSHGPFAKVRSVRLQMASDEVDDAFLTATAHPLVLAEPSMTEIARIQKFAKEKIKGATCSRCGYTFNEHPFCTTTGASHARRSLFYFYAIGEQQPSLNEIRILADEMSVFNTTSSDDDIRLTFEELQAVAALNGEHLNRWTFERIAARSKEHPPRATLLDVAIYLFVEHPTSSSGDPSSAASPHDGGGASAPFVSLHTPVAMQLWTENIKSPARVGLPSLYDDTTGKARPSTPSPGGYLPPAIALMPNHQAQQTAAAKASNGGATNDKHLLLLGDSLLRRDGSHNAGTTAVSTAVTGQGLSVREIVEMVEAELRDIRQAKMFPPTPLRKALKAGAQNSIDAEDNDPNDVNGQDPGTAPQDSLWNPDWVSWDAMMMEEPNNHNPMVDQNEDP